MSTANFCSQLLWIKHQLEDYDIFETKHIEIKHNFIRDYIQKGILDMKFISTNEQLADIFTKPLLEDKLIHIRDLLGMKFMNEV
ncbi:Copia protein, partial [Mucuna pruriens]